MISALTVLRADESVLTRTRWSYILLAEEMRRIVAQPKKDAHELFRRMCFNALISNLDDHPRNHALIARDQHWALSPAYDLKPSPVIAQERRDLAMECGDQGRFANAKNILSQHARFLLDKDESHKMVAGMREQMGPGTTQFAPVAFQRGMRELSEVPSSTLDFLCRRTSVLAQP